MEASIFIFVYGTLLNDKVLKCFDFKLISSRKATLKDFKRISIVDAVYPTAIRQAGSIIDGLVYGITKEDLEMLNIYEGIA